MSDDFHRPTYTSPDVHGAYNATQVRLYGIPGPSSAAEESRRARGKEDRKGEDRVAVRAAYSDKLDALLSLIRGRDSAGSIANQALEKIMTGNDPFFRTVASSYVFINSVIDKYMIMLGAIDINPRHERELSAGVIFGYSYEGHCYDLPKPKIMLIPAPHRPIPNDDCGYHLKKDPQNDVEYRVWIVDKLQQCIELEVNQGFVEQLVLEANLPGKRSPTMYAGRMMLGHRSGRLTE